MIRFYWKWLYCADLYSNYLLSLGTKESIVDLTFFLFQDKTFIAYLGEVIFGPSCCNDTLIRRRSEQCVDVYVPSRVWAAIQSLKSNSVKNCLPTFLRFSQILND